MSNHHFSIVVGFLLISLTVQGQIEKAREYLALGDGMIDTGPFTTVIGNIHKAIEFDSTGACGTGLKGFAHGELGYAYFRDGDTDNALKFFDKSILLDPTYKNSYPRLHKAAMLSTQKKTAQAYRLLDEVVEKMPDCTQAYVQRGFLFKSDDKIDLAKKDFKKALELDSREKRLPQSSLKEMRSAIGEKN